jgi:methyl-accepting chemotaxis protein
LQADISRHITHARRSTQWGLLGLLWLHVPVLAASAFGLWPAVTSPQAQPCALAVALSASLASLLCWQRPAAATTRLALAMCLAVTLTAGAASLYPVAGGAYQGTIWPLTGPYTLACLAALCGLVDRTALAAGVFLTLAGQKAATAALAWPAGEAAVSIAPLLAPAAMLLAAAAAWLWLITQLTRTIAAARANMQAATIAAAQMEQALRLASEAATDLSAQAAEDRLAHAFEQEIGARASQAARAAQGVRNAASAMTAVSQETAQRTMAIAETSRDAVANARHVASAVDELAASIATVTANVREVSDASFRAMEEATAANDTVQRLSDAAVRIGHIVAVINSIARKTSMLALNATIEATRAGEAGLGFAVVATEVKELAHQTSAATGNIGQEIAIIRSEIATAVSAIDGMAQTVAQLGGSTVQAACTIDDQVEIAHSIAASAMRAADGTHAVVANLDALTEATTRAETAARGGSNDAEILADHCAGVESSVREFVKSLLSD